MVIERGQVRVFSRNGHDWSDRYAGIVRAAAGLRCKSAIIDGETIVQDSDGRSDFEAKAFGGEQDAPSCDGEALGDLAAVVGVALFTSLPSSIPFIENNIGLIEFAREKVT